MKTAIWGMEWRRGNWEELKRRGKRERRNRGWDKEGESNIVSLQV